MPYSQSMPVKNYDRVQILIEPDSHDKLKRIAAKEDPTTKSLSRLMRKIISNYLKNK
jgi:hypothetical protein